MATLNNNHLNEGQNEIDQDNLVSFEDFAKQNDKSLSTVQRWARQGKVEVVSKDGKRYIIQIQPKIKPVSPKDKVSQDTSIPSLVNDKLFNELLSKITDMGIYATRARGKWVVVSAILLILFILSVATGPAIGIWYYRTNLGYAESEQYKAQLHEIKIANAKLREELTEAENTILNNKKNYQETVGRLTELLENSGSPAFQKLGGDK